MPDSNLLLWVGLESMSFLSAFDLPTGAALSVDTWAIFDKVAIGLILDDPTFEAFGMISDTWVNRVAFLGNRYSSLDPQALRVALVLGVGCLAPSLRVLSGIKLEGNFGGARKDRVEVDKDF